MPVFYLKNKGSFDEWRSFARQAIQVNLNPDDIHWSYDEENTLFPNHTELKDFKNTKPKNTSVLTVPNQFIKLAQNVIRHSDDKAASLLYRILFRLQFEPNLLKIKSDADILKAFAMAKAITKDCHHMEAFVRFREIESTHKNRLFISWYEPDHYILSAVAPFFAKRFSTMDWQILTPKGKIVFLNGKLSLSNDVCLKPDLNDNMDTLWQTYYASTYNPARLSPKTMQLQMPKRFWKNLPEADIIPELIAKTEERLLDMASQTVKPAPAFHQRLQAMHGKDASPTLINKYDETVETLNNDISNCQKCPLFLNATQAVCGKGPSNADIMIIGEQPGDNEDLLGEPFIGPAGQLLKETLKKVGFENENIYLTNAVKHFKYEIHLRKRIHKTANNEEIMQCRHWLLKEIMLIKPKIILTLGASAFFSLSGRHHKMMDIRGRIFEFENLPPIVATVHPSYILRLKEKNKAREEKKLFADNLQEFLSFYQNEIV